MKKLLLPLIMILALIAVASATTITYDFDSCNTLATCNLSETGFNSGLNQSYINTSFMGDGALYYNGQRAGGGNNYILEFDNLPINTTYVEFDVYPLDATYAEFYFNFRVNDTTVPSITQTTLSFYNTDYSNYAGIITDFDGTSINSSGTKLTVGTWNNVKLYFDYEQRLFTYLKDNVSNRVINWSINEADVVNLGEFADIMTRTSDTPNVYFDNIVFSNEIIIGTKPRITSKNPTGDINLQIGETQNFSLQVKEINDDNLTYVWLVDSIDQNNNNSFLLFDTTGLNASTSTITVTVSDKDGNDTTSWNVKIGTLPCYQESPVTNDQQGTDGDCGLLYNGTSSFSGGDGWYGTQELIIDGNWSSGAIRGDLDGILEETYIKPSTTKTIIGATWTVEYATTSSSGYQTKNISIPTSCLDYSPQNIRLRTNSYVYDDINRYYCYDGSWNLIYTSPIPYYFVSEDSLTWDIENSNTAPTIDSRNPDSDTATITESDNVTLSITASDPQNNTLNYSWTTEGSPVGTNSDNYEFQGIIGAGEYNVTVTVTDGEYDDTNSWTVTVSNEAPTIDARSPTASNVAIYVDNSQTFTITASDPEDDVISYQWYLDGNELLYEVFPMWTFVGQDRGIGVYNVTVYVTDSEDNNVSTTWTLTVTAGYTSDYDSGDLEPVVIDGIVKILLSIIAFVGLIAILLVYLEGKKRVTGKRK